MEFTSSDYQASVEKINDISVRIKVVVKSEAFQSNFDQQLTALTKKVKVNGFRPGKVPKAMVEKLHGQELRYDVINDLINKSLKSVASEHKLDVVGQPKVDIVNSEPGAGLEYTAELELFPKPEVKQYEEFKVQVEGEQITDKEVEDSVSHLLEMKSTAQPITDRDIAQLGDLVDLEVSVAHGDEKLGRAEPVMVVLGRGSLPKAVEDAIVGLKVGDTKEVQVAHKHGDHEHMDNYRVNLKSLSNRILPELNDDFVATLGFEHKTVLELKSKVRESLEERRKGELDEAARAKMLEQLLERNTFDVPQGLIDQEIRDILMRMNSGQNDFVSQPNFSVEPFRVGLGETAAKRVRTAIIVDRVAEIEKLEPTESEINQAIVDIANQHGVGVDEVRGQLLRQRQLPSLALELVRSKAIDLLMKRTQIEYVAPQAANS